MERKPGKWELGVEKLRLSQAIPTRKCWGQPRIRGSQATKSGV